MMSVYAIGDLQGCFQPLQALLNLIDQTTPGAQLIFVGDLVNRGPHSLATLRLLRDMGERVQAVLGNHDLHLLAVAQGVRQLHIGDTFTDILDAPDRDELLTWLRHRPLAIDAHEHLFIHAGVLPQWNKEQTLTLAHEVETQLRADNWGAFLRHMYGSTPTLWVDTLTGEDRWRCIINALTRLRFCTPEGDMDLKTKGAVQTAPPGYLPWFDAPERKTEHDTVVFGHWSMLGLMLRPNLISLDSGCVWGGKLSAIQLADRRVLLQVDCPRLQSQN